MESHQNKDGIDTIDDDFKELIGTTYNQQDTYIFRQIT